MWDWTEKFGWVLVVLAFVMLACQLIRFFVWG
jgi:hypothetical protein